MAGACGDVGCGCCLLRVLRSLSCTPPIAANSDALLSKLGVSISPNPPTKGSDLTVSVSGDLCTLFAALALKSARRALTTFPARAIAALCLPQPPASAAVP